MFCTILTKNGCFEGKSQKEAIDSMIKFYGEDDSQADQILSVCGEGFDSLSQEEIDKLQEILDEGVEDFRKVLRQEHLNQKQLKSDWRASV